MIKNKGRRLTFNDIHKCMNCVHIGERRMIVAVELYFEHVNLPGDEAIELEALAVNSCRAFSNAVMSAQKYVLHFEHDKEIGIEIPLFILNELVIAYHSFNEFFKRIGSPMADDHKKINAWQQLEEMKKLRHQIYHRENNHHKHKVITLSNFSDYTDGAIRYDVWGFEKKDNWIQNKVVETVENFKIQDYLMEMADFIFWETEHFAEIFGKDRFNNKLLSKK